MSSRLSFDSRAVLIAVVTLVGFIAVVSFALSFSALAEIAAWARIPRSLAWAVPVILDASIVAYSLAGLVQRSRGESALLSWSLVFVFTLVSIAGNAAHALDIDGGARTAVGVVVAVSAPLSVFLAVHTLGRLVAAPPEAVAETGRVIQLARRARGDHDADLLRQCVDLDRRGMRHQEIADEVGVSRQKVTRLLELAATA